MPCKETMFGIVAKELIAKSRGWKLEVGGWRFGGIPQVIEPVAD
jgi:hypothetical protein